MSDGRAATGEPDNMKAITLTQPWATLVALGRKTIETRSWKTDYRGPLAIHAAKGHPKGLRLGQRLELGEFEVARDKSGMILRGPISWPYRLPLGEVVATCDLLDVVPIEGMNEQGFTKFVCPHIGGGLTYFEFGNGGGHPATVEDVVSDQEPYGDFTPGRFAWLLGNIQSLRNDTVPAKGSLGLWTWEREPVPA